MRHDWKLMGLCVLGLIPGFLGLVYMQSLSDIDFENCLEAESETGGGSRCVEYAVQAMRNDGVNCYREGYTGKAGPFGLLTDFETEVYICEGYGRIKNNCIEFGRNENITNCRHYDVWQGFQR